MKYALILGIVAPGVSPPSRGAWIEISKVVLAGIFFVVAPLAGGVD